MKQRYFELDAIRGIAALLVVLYHYTSRYGEIYDYAVDPAFRFDLGQHGVQLFFMVSGFVIFLTLDKTVHAADFIVSRLSRLYPAYWFSVALTFTVVSFFSLPGRAVDLQSAIINLTMFQKWFKVSNVDGVYWTLAVELSFYLILFVLFLIKQIKRIELISFLWLCGIIFSQYLELHRDVHIPGRIELMLLLKYGHLFIAGMMYYKIMHSKQVFHYFILLLALFAEYYLHGKVVILIAIYFAIFFLFVQGRLTALAVKPLIFLGSISYSLYLIHQNIGYVVIQKLEANHLANSISIIVVPTLVSITIASLMQMYIERPILLIVRARWNESALRQRLIKGRVGQV
ncbi:hypothetical protein MNBD_NITROSPIRAE01-1127 [hydrothermal vent metagenome]|uniref:Acyltransferase 3 domain-containing protein n=1 Tax=hydrothermal vent metagenome TaxID=652676 RepID=A0A3B1CW58_9ZZZZ